MKSLPIKEELKFSELNNIEKKELNFLSNLHKLGKSKSYSMEEVRKHAHSKLKN